MRYCGSRATPERRCNRCRGCAVDTGVDLGSTWRIQFMGGILVDDLTVVTAL